MDSASPDLLQQASESFADRMGVVELAPFSVAKLGIDFKTLPRYLLRDGFPQSWLAQDIKTIAGTGEVTDSGRTFSALIEFNPTWSAVNLKGPILLPNSLCNSVF